MKSIITKPNAALALSIAALLFSITPTYASDSDEKLDAAAKRSYVFQRYLNADKITVSSKDGVITLTGIVSDESHSRLAEDTIASLPGVKSVNNKLTVTETPAERSDTWLYVKVKNTLAFHRSVSATGTKVVLAEGVVTLTGVAANMAAKDLATEYARDVEGVKAVKNEMTIAPASPEGVAQTLAEIIDDASINAQSRMVLVLHRSTTKLKTTLATDSGVVTVGGPAATIAEKDLVTKLLSDVHGVKKVINTMIITPSAAN